MKNTFKVLTLGLAVTAFSAIAADKTAAASKETVTKEVKVEDAAKAPGAPSEVKSVETTKVEKVAKKHKGKKKEAPKAE